LQFLIKKKFNFFFSCFFFQFLVIKALDPDPDPDPYWPPSGSGSGSVKNEYGSTTLVTNQYFSMRQIVYEY
jgi:hypothetical protein